MAPAVYELSLPSIISLFIYGLAHSTHSILPMKPLTTTLPARFPFLSLSLSLDYWLLAALTLPYFDLRVELDINDRI